MPFYYSEESKKAAECYFTILALVKNSVKLALAEYNSIEDIINWENEISRNRFSMDQVITEKNRVLEGFNKLDNFVMVVKKGDNIYPDRLATIEGSPNFLFLSGDISLLDKPVVSIVGSRKASEDGVNKARRLSRLLAERGIIVASGLATGIDRAAHQGTYDAMKPTIAVIGTPINKVYPKEHSSLQEYIRQTGLVISQFAPSFPVQRWNFPLRNATMSGISIATIVVEAGETSGALIQAREALKQGREVFIPQSAVDNPNLKWPKKYINELGANMFTTIDNLMQQLHERGVLSKVKEPWINRANSTIDLGLFNDTRM